MSLPGDTTELVIGMVAGEASGDTLGADLMAELKSRHPNARFVGIGGPKMISKGFESWFPMETLSVMGFFEVLKHLPKLLKTRKRLIDQLLSCRPDVFIGVDAPDFNFTVERKLKKEGIPTVHYVGPSVWAWREKRLLKIKEAVDGVLVLFPFEPQLYQRYGIPVQFVGHPLAKRFPLHPDPHASRKRLDLPQNAPVTAILPGSRMSEIEKMAEIYLQAAEQVAQIYPDMLFIIPCVHDRARRHIEKQVDRLDTAIKVSLFDQQSESVLEACDQVVVTSGTASLECALMKRPMVIAIKVHPISYWIMKKLATTQWIGLPNILAGESLVSELIQNEATAENVSASLERLIEDPALRERQVRAFEKQHGQLNRNASRLAADAVERWAAIPSIGKWVS